MPRRTAEYKRSILEQADRGEGAIGALLRRDLPNYFCNSLIFMIMRNVRERSYPQSYPNLCDVCAQQQPLDDRRVG